MTRWVMHVDMDAFYASVEVNARPSLEGRPVVVGGSEHRGVVASASYQARAYGVRSAMPVGQARRLCPHAVFLRPRFELYKRASAELHEILASLTPLVEPVALDEAFLDLSGATALLGTPAEVAATTRRKVAEKLGLPASVGVGPNKLVAKLASEAAKPRVANGAVTPGAGVVVVPEDRVLEFLWPLRASSLWGVGPVSSQRLASLGVAKVGDLARLPRDVVASVLGNAAGRLAHELAWGHDDRPVVPHRAPKSIGHEETFESGSTDRDELSRRLALMVGQVAARVRAAGMVARTVTVKLRYEDFRTLTRSHTFPGAVAGGPVMLAAARELFNQISLGDGVRLLGFSASGLLPKEGAPGEQLQLELAPRASWDKAMEVVDQVRQRFGYWALRPAGARREQA